MTPDVFHPSWQPAGGFDLQGHRGARGHLTENTLPGFVRAVELGCTSVELDVQLSADGRPVVWHDPVLDPAKCPPGHPLAGSRVAELTAEQLASVAVGTVTDPAFAGQQPADGAGITTLDEVFDRLRDLPVGFVVEVKTDPQDPAQRERRPDLVDAVLEAVDRQSMPARSLIHSFDWAVLEQAARQAPWLPRSALATAWNTFAPGSVWLGSLDYEDFGGDLPAAAAAAGAQVVAPSAAAMYGAPLSGPGSDPWVTAEFVGRAHDLGLLVVPWTVNDPADIGFLLAAGVDGMVSDYPERVTGLREAKR